MVFICLTEWLDLGVVGVGPRMGEFLAEMGLRVDPAGYNLLDENAGLLPGHSEARNSFSGYLWAWHH